MTVNAEAAKLLVVDDDANNRDMLSRRLERAGYNVRVAASGREALEMIEHSTVELVLLDSMMPGMSGVDLLRLLRATWSSAELPVIMVTAVDDSGKIVEALDLGANDYITKPVDFDVTMARVRAHMERKRSLDHMRASEERYALAALGSQQGIWDWDLNAGAVYYSARWREILGLELEEITRKPEEWFSRVHPEDQAQFQEALRRHLEDKTSLEFIHECRMLHSDSASRWVLCRAMTQREANGQARRLAGTLNDVTQARAYDALTGLGNRTLFHDRLTAALSAYNADSSSLFAVMSIDLKQFNLINERFGTVAGDTALCDLSRRLVGSLRVNALREPDLVARLGGDEFAILLSPVPDSDIAGVVGKRVQEALFSPLNVDGHEVLIAARIGVAVARPGYQNADEVIRDADTALNEAKSHGESAVVLFDESMRSHAVARGELEADLHKSIERQQLRSYFQPKLTLKERKLIGFEALVRWEHPLRGLITPAFFIPLAEETGFIAALGLWMLRESCQTLSQWHREFPAVPPIEISVNVSIRQFRDAEFVEKVAAILRETGVPPSSIQLEVTESVVMDTVPETLAMLNRLKALGVGIKIDDFGTGYSSLNYLHRLPCNALKIDRSFVMAMQDDPNCLAIVQTVLALSEKLHLDVIAEGVETEEQAKHLEFLGCQYGQGYLFSKPMDRSDATAYLRKHWK